MDFQTFPSLFDQPEFGKSLPMQIAEYIVHQIFRGELHTGDHLKEEELAARFHTSRAPVREALYLLQVEGLVERLPRKRTVVREYTDEELAELYDVRIGLECLALERLAAAEPSAIAARMEEILRRMEAAVEAEDAQTYAHLNDVFHQTLVQGAGNQMLWRIYRQMNNILTILLQVSTQDVVEMQTSVEEHKAIYAAMAERDWARAKELLTQHVRHGMDRALVNRR
ncbi:MAG: GntR family transcriptional regulator [Alicyclobacillus sp.]|nr:GntR family transcriptional regulator [Alicyclobacillus sp.]